MKTLYIIIAICTLTSCSTTKNTYNDDIYYSSRDIIREKQIDHRYPESNYYSSESVSDSSDINPNSGYYKQTYTTIPYDNYSNSCLYNPYYLYGTNFHLGYSLYGYGFNLYNPYWYYPYTRGYWIHHNHNWGNNWNHNWNHNNGYNNNYYYGHRNIVPHQRSQDQYQQKSQTHQYQRNFLQTHTNHNFVGGRSVSTPSHSFGGHSSGHNSGGRGRR